MSERDGIAGENPARNPSYAEKLQDALDGVRAVGERLRALRAKQAQDSPLAGTAFDLACLVGDMERELLAELRGANGDTPPAGPVGTPTGGRDA